MAAEILKELRDRKPSVRLLAGDAADLEWFANNVRYHVSGRNIDILMFHRTRPFSEDLPISARVQYTVVELKREEATKKDLQQLLGYCDWVGAQLAAGELHTVQPILVAHAFSEEVQSYATSVRTAFKTAKLIAYRVEKGELRLFLPSLEPVGLQARPPLFAEPTQVVKARRRSAQG